MDNLEEMDKFLEMFNLPRLNQEEIENMNRLITSNVIEPVIIIFKIPINKTIKFLEENTGGMLFGIALSNNFWICLLRQGKQK